MNADRVGRPAPVVRPDQDDRPCPRAEGAEGRRRACV